jgi:ArsR family transcriptional regulator
MSKTHYLYDVADEAAVLAARSRMPSQDVMDRLSAFYKIMSDPTRLRLLIALEDGELCASDLANALDMSRSAVSHQLKSLKEARLVKTRREGKTIHYSLDDNHILQVLQVAAEHVQESQI